VFLHEGLGSRALWKDFPQQIVAATQCKALVYSRYGYGDSDALQGARGMDFMHEEALLALPELLDRLEVERPLLFGHSDGGSIALIHAGGSQRPVAGLMVMAPHVFVEDLSVSSIQAAKLQYLKTDWRDKLGRYHADPDSAFWGWNDIWLRPEFRAWNIEEYLPQIRCKILAIQGEDDNYGTMEQLERIQRGAPQVEVLKLAQCGHSPHRDQPKKVIAAVTRYVNQLIHPPQGVAAVRTH
jgi:pimeloyl-ACP methyl ester carboxylesterase